MGTIPRERKCIGVVRMRSILLGKFPWKQYEEAHEVTSHMATETVNSGVVSLRNLRLTMFLAELNNLQLWGANVGNAHLQALEKKSCTL